MFVQFNSPSRIKELAVQPFAPLGNADGHLADPTAPGPPCVTTPDSDMRPSIKAEPIITGSGPTAAAICSPLSMLF